MREFSAHLTREKFVIYDPEKDPKAQKGTTALSNRIVVDMVSDQQTEHETFVVRAQNMHSCARFAALILKTFHTDGALLTRRRPYDWNKAWDVIVNDYEFAFNVDRWICIYNQGKLVFSKGQHHPFLDVIEKCDHANDKGYDYAVPMAEQSFEKSGKRMAVNYDANVALVSDFNSEKGYCGIIFRGPDKTTKFNFLVEQMDEKKPVNVPQCLSVAAAFLEGIQLSFMTGMNVEKIRLGIIERLSKEEKQHQEANKRLFRLAAEIANLESDVKVRYRPEKPDFLLIQAEAEEIAQRIFAKREAMPPRSKSAKNEAG